MINALIVGMGRMGQLHAQAFASLDNCQVVGLCSPRIEQKNTHTHFPGIPRFTDFTQALAISKPDLVCIATPTRFHAQYALQSLEAGAHVFVEKPVADNLQDAQQVFDRADRLQRKVLVGHILRFHPLWQQFVNKAKKLGSPVVMRFSLNQQSDGELWSIQQKLLQDTTALVDGGVHYVDVMQQIVLSDVVETRSCHVPLAATILPNYSHIQICFADGSLGLFEAGWGPMIGGQDANAAEVTGPLGSVSLRSNESGEYLLCHSAALDNAGNFSQPDPVEVRAQCPDIHELCRRQLQYLVDCIQRDSDMQVHYQDVLSGLRIVSEYHCSPINN
ncbi:Gfo/Idh/MocA family protein [Porticoccus sp. GXU_MW_L64]